MYLLPGVTVALARGSGYIRAVCGSFYIYLLQMGIVEQHQGTYYSLRLEGMKEEFDKMYLSILEPIEENGETRWVEKMKAKWIDHVKLVSLKIEEKTLSNWKKESIISLLFSSEGGRELYWLSSFFNGVSRKLLENIFWCWHTDQYHLLTDFDISFWKSKPYETETWAKKRANCCKIRSVYLEDYWRYHNDEDKNKLVKKIEKAKWVERDYWAYDLEFEKLLVGFNNWFKENEMKGIPGDIVTKNEHGEVVENNVETPNFTQLKETIPHPDTIVAPVAPVPVKETTKKLVDPVMSADDLPF
jgi:hypothetical protein